MPPPAADMRQHRRPRTLPPVRFSIIVPVFNTADHLDACITALQALEWPKEDYEIILVDNGSTDRSPEILAATSGIRVFHEPKRGSYAARNLGVRESQGEALVFTDSDCFPDPGWLREIADALSAADVHLVLGAREAVGDGGLIQMLSEYEESKNEYVFSSHIPQLYYGFTNNLAVRRSIFDRYGPFLDRPRGADAIFVRRVVDGEGCRSVAYHRGIRVVHAEMDSLWRYCLKVFTYGRSRQLYRHISTTRPLTFAERRFVLRACLRNKPYPWWRQAALVGGLAAGAVAWHLGSVVGRLRTPS
jgi:glycosyltransferase involved in cell wall biosynthesis